MGPDEADGLGGVVVPQSGGRVDGLGGGEDGIGFLIGRVRTGSVEGVKGTLVKTTRLISREGMGSGRVELSPVTITRSALG
jgi:hypothetical protein